ncbi:signal peptide peptidase SppA [Sphingobacterium rhinopitheci]|uniref:signal peptide peptidase SppA n=1 Tax=Sphingobacterium rhinopitheci TaxID=2781960 RepID=UPI001F5169A2|nr:signal peptide peptidase SppA [Sphingobacterium rhinopitheci]MCI0920206.1 signal peptide peptidase SppA [Sphingobacterium rhinopitheci]
MNFIKQVLATVTGIIVSTVLLFIGLIFLVGVLVQQSTKDAVISASPNSILYISLDYNIVEKTESNPLEDIDVPFYNSEKSIGLNDILARIKSAKSDDNIKGIYLNTSTVGLGYASLEAIRTALLDFKATKKFIVAYSDVYSQKAYYLASVADKIYLNPEGSLDFKGISSSVVFMKEALDKLGIEMQVIKVGTYKSAVEPFILNEMSPANREQVNSYINSIYTTFLADISVDRKITVDSLRSIADNYLIRNADDALKYKFIDGKLYKDELLSEIKKRLNIKEDDDISSVSILKYSGNSTIPTAKDEVAVLYAYGDIVDGEGKVGQIGGDKISKELRKLRQDDNVKAVVLRVNSGGGSALASEIIWREVELTKKVKPIMVSMGDYAASGGYYIAAAADSIFAEESTLTGSIGVFGLIPNMKDLLNNKLGVHIEEVNTGRFSGLMSSVADPLTAEERSIIQVQVNSTYNTFMNRVAAGRHISVAAVDSIGQGRVWTGKQALSLGLVDKIGNTASAINAAASKAGIKDYKVAEYPVKEDTFFGFLSSTKDQIKMMFLEEELGIYKRYIIDVKKVLQQSGIQARLPYNEEIY